MEPIDEMESEEGFLGEEAAQQGPNMEVVNTPEDEEAFLGDSQNTIGMGEEDPAMTAVTGGGQMDVSMNPDNPVEDLASIIYNQQGMPSGDHTASPMMPNQPQQPQQPPPVVTPPGFTHLEPVDVRNASQIASQEYMSITPTGILTDVQDRLSYVMAVMENYGIPSDKKAQLVDQAMRDGKILLQALPKQWYEARGLQPLPPGAESQMQPGAIPQAPPQPEPPAPRVENFVDAEETPEQPPY